MALYVILKSTKSNGRSNELQCHIPFKNNLPALVNEEIDFIQADGDELERILDCFKGIPVAGELVPAAEAPVFVPNRVVKWFGETARFIYENLRSS